MFTRIAAFTVALGVVTSTVSVAATTRTLTLGDRIAAQRAIEQVYWNHRIWPKENPGRKPELTEVMTDDALRAKVDDYLKESNALEALWRRPITAQQLQAEIDRMAQGSRDPEILRELFAALGNDPSLIAETLARQTLADRLLRSWYATDARFHGEVKARAEKALASCGNPSCMKSVAAQYVEATAKRGDLKDDGRAAVLDGDAWQGQLDQLARRFDTTADALPLRKLSRLDETEDAFVATAVLARSADAITTASVVWPKTSFDRWWNAMRETLDANVPSVSESFVLKAPATGGCALDTWKPTYWWMSPRSASSAIWTGAEMIVWGGYGTSGYLNSGGRYNPSTDSWVPTSATGRVPATRYQHTAIWTGSEMIVWGGYGPAGYLNTGGRYNPSTDSWVTMSATGSVPEARYLHTAVWTGSEMIVWGGYGSNYLSTGGRYNPTTDSWLATSVAASTPTARQYHTAIWTGTEMIVWGGVDHDSYVNNGARYNPSTDSWVATSVTGSVPVAREVHTAVWTGTEMIVWGGYPHTNTGGRYNPTTNSWLATSVAASTPTARYSHTAVWTGTEMIVWGGTQATDTSSNGGGRYNPTTDSWSATSTGANVPEARTLHLAVWTGSEMIVWSGVPTRSTSYSNMDGGRYNASTDTWLAISATGTAPALRYAHTAVWTGSEMILWGGVFSATGGYTNTGARYNPATDSWTATPTGANSPGGRKGHTAIWTGNEMIVWGGWDGVTEYNAGHRYNPTTNSWLLTSNGANVPTGRYYHTAVWTGTEMIVWGGSSLAVNTGGRYKVSTDSWLPTSIGANVPVGRSYHTAVWTGTEMIVWGGGPTQFGIPYNSGGRFNPSTNSWLATSTGANVPAARSGHTAVWTGSEMLVWGATNSPGGRYNPSNDSWAAISTGANSPPDFYRNQHTAIWTGSEMIVWGGYSGGSGLASGGRYKPTTDSWIPTFAAVGTPTGRYSHTAVFTGTEMIVWGGVGFSDRKLGERYCVAGLVYRDADGDGYGDPAVTAAGSLTSIPAGYVSNASDCDDTNASIHPGASEACNGLDDNCDGQIDEGLGRTLYRDADGDGYGVTATTQFTCFSPAGWSTLSGDCNDAAASIHPGATDICNGIDDNCNGQVDEDASGADSDGDGIHNACDNCRFVANPTQLDSDADGAGNACDNCLFVPNPSQLDTDLDGLGDVCDNCPSVPNASQADTDLDRVGDVCDDCPLDYNPSQSDFNHNGEGDACDLTDGLIYVLGTDDKNFVEWQQESGPTSWNVYEGDLSVLRATGIYTQTPGSNPLAGRTCGVTDLFVADAGAIAAGAVKFSLVTGVTGGLEGNLGTNSAGAPRANTNPCP